MFRPALRAATAARSGTGIKQVGRRFASNTTTKSRSWKGTAARWTAAGAVVYYYNTSTIFADEPHYAPHAPPETQHESETYSNIDIIAEQRRAQARQNLRPSESASNPSSSAQTSTAADGEQTAVGGPAELEEEAEQQGAFNEETGEINWDCPCLGGMAHGPCGEQFRAAFSCFVYSKEEPKGVDCIEHFKTMQNCFREHPDIYGAELDDDEVAEVQAEEDRAQAAIAQSKEAQATGSSPAVAQASRPDGPGQVEEPSSQDKRSAEHQSETSELVPKAWHDGRESKTEK